MLASRASVCGLTGALTGLRMPAGVRPTGVPVRPTGG
uniref:Uncharacterized protein n=1 Tax=Setaria italica TaxID=4555 RepID=K3Y3R6_SETIT